MQTINDTLNALHLGQTETFEGLTLVPLLGEARNEPGYLTLDQALEQKTARVLEVSEGGSVPNLLFENLGEEKVLLVDGDELVGAKQNRIINLTILVAAHSTIKIPVSCVEAGRWSYRSREFKSLRRSMYAKVRAEKSEHVTVRMRRSGERYSDQAAVWDNIADCSANLKVDSRTGSMEDIFAQQEARLQGYRQAFQARENQRGAVFAVHGTVQGMEVFDSARPFSHYLERLVESYAIEAMRSAEHPSAVPSDRAVEKFVAKVGKARFESYPAIGIGEDLRLSGEGLAGGALLAEGQVVHLAAFRLDASGKGKGGRVLHFRNRPAE